MNLENLEQWKLLSELARNVLAALGIAGAIFAFWKWTRERLDRSTEVLFQLEDRFNADELPAARSLIEDSAAYETFRGPLFGAVAAAFGESNESERLYGTWAGTNKEFLSSFDALDALLRFYVLLAGVRAARQVRDRALRSCFRFWLSHSYRRDRWELASYIFHFYPTLREWLQADCRLSASKRFFQPEQFGWASRPRPGRAQLREDLRSRVLVITGAGVSAESGVATFRGCGGYWTDPDARELTQTATFRKDPQEVWKWYSKRRRALDEASPNRAHESVARLVNRAAVDDVLLVTQNVDDLHEQAGTRRESIVHIHGSIWSERCDSCGTSRQNRGTWETELPVCPECHGALRPGVVWFDEEYRPGDQERINEFVKKECAVVLLVGTSGVFHDIGDWARKAAGKKGCIVEINPEETAVTPLADVVMRTSAGEALSSLIQG